MCCLPQEERPSLQPTTFQPSAASFCLDYAFPPEVMDEDVLTVCVAKLYPYKAVACIPCEVKGGLDKDATSRLASFVKAFGCPRISYMGDQESALNDMTQVAIKQLNVDASWARAAPSNSAV